MPINLFFHGHNQATVQYRIARSIQEFGKPCYSGRYTAAPRQCLTSTVTGLSSAVWYAYLRSQDRIGGGTLQTYWMPGRKKILLTDKLCVLAINGTQYNDVIEKGTERNEYVISRPISLEDMTVIYAKGIDRLDEFAGPEATQIRKCIHDYHRTLRARFGIRGKLNQNKVASLLFQVPELRQLAGEPAPSAEETLFLDALRMLGLDR